jgi:hypothetical protein
MSLPDDFGSLHACYDALRARNGALFRDISSLHAVIRIISPVLCAFQSGSRG